MPTLIREIESSELIARLLGSERLRTLVWRRSPFVPVFMLHRLDASQFGIEGHTKEDLTAKLEWLRKNDWSAITARELAECIVEGRPLAPKTLVFTLDDGYQDQYEMISSVFESFDYAVTIYVTTGFLDGTHWIWDAQIKYICNRTKLKSYSLVTSDVGGPSTLLSFASASDRKVSERFLKTSFKSKSNSHIYRDVQAIASALEVDLPNDPPSEHSAIRWAEARDLASRGHEVAPHSDTHRVLSQIHPVEWAHEIEASVSRTTAELGFEPTTFAYPVGRAQDFSCAMFSSLESQGIKLAFCAEPGFIEQPLQQHSRYSAPRLGMPFEFSRFLRYAVWLERFREFLFK